MPAFETLTDLHVLPGQVMSYTSTGENNSYIGLQAPTSGGMTASGPYASLTNDGEIRFTSSRHTNSYLVVHSLVIGGGNTILNRGLMRLDASEGSAGLIHMGNGGATVRNQGTMEVYAERDAHILREMFMFDVVNSGVMRVTAGNFAFGLICLFRIELTNTNTIWVTSTGSSAWGVSMGYGDGSYVVNSGMISARATGPAGFGVGVDMGSAYTDTLLENSGTVQGSHASVTGGGESFDGRHIIRNSGTLNGDVVLGRSRADVLNTGTINGDVFLGGSNDLFAGGAGILNGAIFGESGNDAITTGLGDDWLDGGEGNDRLDAGGGDNVMRGANGEDVFISGAGADRIDGGADGDTVDYSGLGAGVTVNLGITAAQDTGAGGLDTLVSVERVRGTAFNDTLTATTSPIENFGRVTKLETRDNRSIETAVSLDGLFALREDLDFEDSLTTPHVVVTAANSGGREYYRFTVTEAGSWGRFDIDHVDYSWNLSLTLYDAAGNQIIVNYDWPQDQGSNSPADPYLQYLFAEPGVYYIAVDQQTTHPLNVGTKYTLTVGIEGAPVTNGFAGSTLWGGGGDDTLIASAGTDRLDGGDGEDTVVFSGLRSAYTITVVGADTHVNGPHGRDVLSGVERLRFADALTDAAGVTIIEAIQGTADNDILSGADQDDILLGLGGDDTLSGAGGDDVLAGAAGADTLDGGDGVDTADYSQAATGVTASLIAGSASVDGDGGSDSFVSIENLTGSAFADSLTGDANANVLVGGAGGDTLNGEGGDDALRGGGGVDALNGGAGFDTADYSTAAAGVTARLDTMRSTNDGDGGTDTFVGIEAITGSNFNDLLIGGGLGDTLRGGLGADTLLGQDGNDVLWGGAGAANQLQGGLGDDWYVLEANDSVIESAGQGTDTVEARIAVYTLSANVENLVFGGVGNFTGAGNALNNTLTGGAGDDVLRGRGGTDILQGGLGMDTADYSLAAAAIHARLDNMRAVNDGDGGTDTFVGIEAIVGSNFNDLLVGGGLGDRLSGGFGADTLLGFAGNDILAGGQGAANQLQGGTGDDLYILDAYDTVVELAGQGVDTVEAHVGAHNLGANVENMYYVGNNKFYGTGNALNNVITGGVGDDILKGMGGNDTLRGGAGRDEVQFRGAMAQYTVTAEGAGYRIVDSIAGRDGSTFVESIEVLRFMTGNTVSLLSYPPAAPAAPEPAGKAAFDAQVLPALVDGKGEDAFVLPALPDDEPLVLPGPEAFKGGEEPLVLPESDDATPLFLALEAHLPLSGDWMLTMDGEPVARHDDWMS